MPLRSQRDFKLTLDITPTLLKLTSTLRSEQSFNRVACYVKHETALYYCWSLSPNPFHPKGEQTLKEGIKHLKKTKTLFTLQDSKGGDKTFKKNKNTLYPPRL